MRQREAAARRELEGKEFGRCDSDRQTHRPSEDTTVGSLSPESVKLLSSIHWWEAELVVKSLEETDRRS